MILYSTNHKAPDVNLKEAVITGLPPDNGLYMPSQIPVMPEELVRELTGKPFNEMSYGILRHLFGDYLPGTDLRGIIDAAFDFDAPVHWMRDGCGILELFHGPTLAFKDFGARFMGRLLEYFLRDRDEIVDILVATSGDTGSAVAHGFLNTHGIRVTILYPKGKVSEIQEKQFATLGANIRVLEIEGTFDNCQSMVKKAFLDPELKGEVNLSSANSINIARLIPQSLYYFRAYAQLKDNDKPLVLSVPSGNFGNLTAGLMARAMGLPVHRIIASNNSNDVFTEYWHTGQFTPRPSVQTLSNAMDVGDPSNFKRILDLYQNNWNAIKTDIPAYAYGDAETLAAIRQMFSDEGYIMCPHTAVGWMGLHQYRRETGLDANYISLATAHPVKFKDIVDNAIGQPVPIPERLGKVMGSEKLSIPMPHDYTRFREFLMENK